MNIKDIEVGMYIRRDDAIGQVCNVYEDELRINTAYCERETMFEFELDNKTKASHNITGVIKTGDYVNGYEVVEVTSDYVITTDKRKFFIPSKDIKSVVTKEYFKQGEFKL